MAQRIATALAARLTRPEQKALTAKPTTNLAAHEAYLRGRYLWNKRSATAYPEAAEYLCRALALDPNYAAAYAGLSDACQFIANSNSEWIFSTPRRRRRRRPSPWIQPSRSLTPRSVSWP
ncbi:MAG: hypothetical protein ABI233_03195 [Chthoniobacterales bacterium]